MISLKSISKYYTEKATLFGASPAGVDWNGAASQNLRFEVLSKLFNKNKKFSVDDYGCGYGAYLDYLLKNGFKTDYLGLDLSDQMITLASVRHPKGKFLKAAKSPRVADYAIASGIFNVALKQNRKEWFQYLLRTVNHIHQSVKLGFAFNCLSSYSEKRLRKPHLFYIDPCIIFDYCKNNLSKKISLLHDYELFEFTIILRKI